MTTGIDEHDRSAGRSREVEREKPAQARRFKYSMRRPRLPTRSTKLAPSPAFSLGRVTETTSAADRRKPTEVRANRP